MEKNARDQLEKMLKNQETSKLYIEARRKELELREKELMEWEAFNDNQRQDLLLLKQMNERAAEEQKRYDESLLKLAEEQKKAKETLHQKNMDFLLKLNLKHALELDIEHLTGAKNVTEQMGDDQESLNEKKEDLEALNQALVVDEQRANVELTDARKELIDLIKEHSFRASIGVKRMGELDSTRFREITKSKFLGTDADLKATQLCSVWEHHLVDPNWHPFKDVTRENGSKEIIIDDSDERLNRLKHEFGQAAYDLLWNYKLGRKATLNEGITFALQKLKNEDQ
ncbi:hypothetical protein R3W88_014026 [Solanum pinnatisectum]|uniref:Factor of DNA methylation 1-5/IDN2 domain-containing protein n=1 Tax=Solanum pinnatisectum TaxID=50273 RepID=A0AAV9KQT7_9SOLN|nr:hypothetical protein R3W88_014026 [Solanum pinnatisectum]